MNVATAILNESEYSSWDEFVAVAPTGSAYATSRYLDALCNAAGGRFRILVARQRETILGGVGLYEQNSPFGTFVSPRLLLYYNGPVLRQGESTYPSERTALDLKTTAAIETAIRQMRYASVKLKPRAALVDLRSFLARGWSATHGYTYVVSIADLAQTRLRVEHNLRRLIDRCTRDRMAFAEDDDFASFFRLHELTMQRVGFRAYLPQAAFRAFYHELNAAKLIRVFQARLPDGAPIAAQLVLLGHRVTHTVSAAADPAHLKSGASTFLRWRVFERLHQLGYEANDLTDASLNPVTHFKSQFGGELQPLVELKSPESIAFRIGSELSKLTQRSRATAAVAVRRVVGRRSPTPQ